MKKTAVIALVIAGAAAARAVPIVEDVTLVQSEATRKVKVSYKLKGEHAIVTVDFLTNGVSIGEANFTSVYGDVNRFISPSGETERRIFWQPDRDWAGHSVSGMTAVVSAWCTNAPPEYLDIQLGTTYPLVKRYYVSKDAVPGGITNVLYKTTHLLMRKCPAAGREWSMGARPTDCAGDKPALHRVVLSSDFYIGVYEYTLKQWKAMGGSTDRLYFLNIEDADICPAAGLAFENICGTGRTWPLSTDALGSSSVMYKLASASGLKIDLPTEAQWEFACRAGCEASLYDGTEYVDVYSVTNLAWTSNNSGGTTHPVGLKKPNAWDLYDMLGNVEEHCLDWEYPSVAYEGIPSDGAAMFDPVGPDAATNNRRMMRGGCYFAGGDLSRPCSRYRISTVNNYTSTAGALGFRVCCPAVIPE